MAPKAETFVKSCLLDTFVDPKFAQNVEHSTKFGVQTERRGAARRGRGAKLDDSYALRALGGQIGDAPEAGFRS